jgi:hypothetical protein
VVSRGLWWLPAAEDYLGMACVLHAPSPMTVVLPLASALVWVLWLCFSPFFSDVFESLSVKCAGITGLLWFVS